MTLLGENFCDCDECKIDGVCFPMPKHHDCDYVRARSALVPQAVAIANERCPIDHAGCGGPTSAQWLKCFAQTMDELSAPLLNGEARARS